MHLPPLPPPLPAGAAAPPPCGTMIMGRLYPSTRLTSKKSMPPEPSSVNSMSVAGGAAPPPLHWMPPEPQSPVAQVNLPVASSAQSVRAHMRPDQLAGASTVADAPCASANPVVDSGAVPAPDSSPGHTV
ncbi:Os03g0244333 [Oryza sativa Japonica Group]|uniref:Os03g0244333 protein n=1 Tax=Oryza sativa subsp. japonica TaxID=39947 RepID=A0A0P0VVF4_ORYSJ|nr:hypothetical protein EE612_016443 [Oryza sativa]BAS83223.1 Os03g0244333 [Oryza sativa Japonica Group]